MKRDIKFHNMRKVIQDADLPQRELIEILAMFMSDLNEEKVAEWFKELKEKRADLERRSQQLLAEFHAIEMRKFDPMI